MNSIRWMPMIRWLKFPLRVHILHKTVQLSVHELSMKRICVCGWMFVWKHAQQCHLAPEHRGGRKAGTFSVLMISVFALPSLILYHISVKIGEMEKWKVSIFFVIFHLRLSFLPTFNCPFLHLTSERRFGTLVYTYETRYRLRVLRRPRKTRCPSTSLKNVMSSSCCTLLTQPA